MYSDNMLGVALMISDTILPMPNLAKTVILLLRGYRLVTKYHLMTIFLPGPEVVTISDNQCMRMTTEAMVCVCFQDKGNTKSDITVD